MSNKELNTVEQDSTENNSSLNQPGSRRKFFKKAALGAAITTIPSHSVWAGRLISGNMSGNVSGWAEENDLGVLSHGYFKKASRTELDSERLKTFSSVFGGEPIANSGHGSMPTGLTLLEVMQNNKINNVGSNKTGGPGNVNMQLAAMYLNAAFHGSYGIHWPVISSGLYNNLTEYAYDLYAQATALSPGAAVVGCQLDKIIHEYHVGSESLAIVCS